MANISIADATKETLDSLKQNPRETYDDVVVSLIRYRKGEQKVKGENR